MTSIVFYFQVHQPYRLRQYSYLEVGEAEDYFEQRAAKALPRD